MALKNSEEGVEISFKMVDKEDEEIEVRFFFFFFFLQNILNPDSKIWILKSGIYSTTGFNKSGLKTIYRISKSGFYYYYRICDIR